MQTRVIKHYIEQINVNTGETFYVIYNQRMGVHRTTSEMNSADGIDDAGVANRVANQLNNINKEMKSNFYYYRVDSDNQTRRIIRDDAPEEVKAWFADDEVEEEEEETEGE